MSIITNERDVFLQIQERSDDATRPLEITRRVMAVAIGVIIGLASFVPLWFTTIILIPAYYIIHEIQEVLRNLQEEIRSEEGTAALPHTFVNAPLLRCIKRYFE